MPKKPQSKLKQAPAALPLRGSERYCVDRFLGDCSDETYKFLKAQWMEGNQLFASRIPVDGLPPVVMLAAYARLYSVELVDDYDLLIERYQCHIKECYHPDKFFSSCISILADRGQYPELESFEILNIPNIYEELLP
jgi:hypothetical protein